MNRRATFLIHAAFFLSGVAGLIYQVAWSRYLGLLLGSSGPAYIIVLATFMGGLGLGAWLFGRMADRVKSCLNLFIVLELSVAGYGAAFPWIFELVRSLFVSLARGQEPGSPTLMALKVATAVAVILPPTVLMGGTLPVLGKYLVDRLSAVGHRVSVLYYVNSFGAVVGTLLAGFLLIGHLGLTLSMLTGAMLDIVVALIMRAQSHQFDGAAAAPETNPEPALQPADDAEIYPEALGRIALIVIGISGGVSMLYEVLWIRMLALILGSSIYSFALMVAAFISGITLGSFLLTFKKDDREYYPLLGYLQILIGMSLLLTLPLLMQLPWIFHRLMGLLARNESSFVLFQLVQYSAAFLVMGLPTIFIGMTLPAASKITTRSLRSLGGSVGATFGINTAGTLVGAAVGGALLMPNLGILGALLVGVALNIAMGLTILATAPPSHLVSRRQLSMVLVVVNWALLLAMVKTTWDERVLLVSIYRRSAQIPSYNDYWQHIHNGDVIYRRDGMDATVAVIKAHEGGHRALTINGKPDASAIVGEPHTSNDNDMPTQLLLGHIPMLAHPAPANVLVVGQGSGVTAGAVAMYPEVHVDLVELSPEVAATAEFFAPTNRAFHELPNVRVIVEDARTHLLLAETPYDVIISEPSNPWTAGNASLFTREYYAECARVLRPGGLMLQWVHCYEIDDLSLRMIFGTFRETFPYLSVWYISDGDVAVLGSREPYTPDLALLASRMKLPEVSSDLHSIGLDVPAIFLGMQVLDVMRTGSDFIGPVRINSEYTPYLEYRAPLGFFLSRYSGVVESFDRRFSAAERSTLWMGLPDAPGVSEGIGAERWEQIMRLARERLNVESPELRRTARLWRENRPSDPWARFETIVIEAGDSPQPTPALLSTMRAPSLETIYSYERYRKTVVGAHIMYLVNNGDGTDAEELRSWMPWIDKMIHASDEGTIYIHELRGRVLMALGDYANAALAFRQGIIEASKEKDPSSKNVEESTAQLVMALLRSGQTDVANHIAKSIASLPNDHALAALLADLEKLGPADPTAQSPSLPQ